MARRMLNANEVMRQRLLRLEQQAKARQEEAYAVASLEQTRTLGEAKGAEFDRAPQKTGERRKPLRRLSGLGWLLAKGKITEQAYQAGARYGEAYRKVQGEAPIRSILDRDVTGGDPVAHMLANAEDYVYAADRLKRYRGMVSGHQALISACDAVCGREQTPREASINGAGALVVEALVIVALDLMIQHLAPAREQNAPHVAKAA